MKRTYPFVIVIENVDQQMVFSALFYLFAVYPLSVIHFLGVVTVVGFMYILFVLNHYKLLKLISKQK